MLYRREWDKPKLDYTAGYTALARAADYLRKRGWGQGNLLDAKNQPCVIQAIKSVAGYEEAQLAWLLLKDYLGEESIAYWNDNICQSKEQAIRTLCEASVR